MIAAKFKGLIRRFYKFRINHLLISRQEFLKDFSSALNSNRPYAAGKLGIAEEYWMYYPLLKKKNQSAQKIKEFENSLEFNFEKQTGLFPVTEQFINTYADFFSSQVNQLNCLGVCYGPFELEILKHHHFQPRLTHYLNLEPDRSKPANDNNCYLLDLRGKKVLIVCPFAGLLRDRANHETFEAVWKNTGKEWFYPADVEALEFPYGFSKETQKKYGTALSLYDSIISRMDRINYDIALIAAAGLANPLAAHVKKTGRIGISLGGHLQVLFGVYGKRWVDMKWWSDLYFNESWLPMPDQYKPPELLRGENVCDNGAYW